jgi:hypothetical protein
MSMLPADAHRVLQRTRFGILEGLDDAEVLKLAAQPTPEPMVGNWCLIAPDGRTWNAGSPIKCVNAERLDRVPSVVALARIRRGLIEGDRS